MSWKQLSPHHDRPHVFVISQWQKQPGGCIRYLLYRWALAIFFSVMVVFSILKSRNEPPIDQARWLIYLTHWGSLICTFQAIFVAILVSKYVCTKNKSKLQKSSTKSYKIYWLSNIIATDWSLFISIAYWALVFNPQTDTVDVDNYFIHVNTGLLMLLDLFIVAHPVRLLHAFYSMLMIVVYGTFTIIYYVMGGVSTSGKEYIYSFLNWKNPGISTTVCMLSLCVVAVLHTFIWSLYKLRTWFYTKCYRLVKSNGSSSEAETKESFLPLAPHCNNVTV